ncbi:NADH dehydrogenase ubiquinone complex I assembly factor 7 [Nymphaea thermarum]|nr:NADH dehydrogenase ubiquinone complex I assembly factor 7 [Nymphaea thermarum]
MMLRRCLTPLLRLRSPSSRVSSLLWNASTSLSSDPSVENLCPNDGKEEKEPPSLNARKFSVDRSGLCNPPEHFHKPSTDPPLVKHLKSIIKFRGGPISVAEYMEEVLTNPTAGFYINRDVFGAAGDFITSPEVSQMFGEMIGVWSVCLWEQMGQPEKVNLIELGPGRGTLMADLLRGTSKFDKFKQSLNIHMVECSPALQKIQHNTLKCVDEQVPGSGSKQTLSMLSGATVSWHAALEQVPLGLPTIIIAHEFYDALPVHQFQKAPQGWCEKMIDVAEDSTKEFRFVLSPCPTAATMLYLKKRFMWASAEEREKLEHVEVCPKAMELSHAIAKRIGSDGGGALIIDYGQNQLVSDSLQAIRKHKFVDVLEEPGSADLSAYVDFPSIKHSAEEASENVFVHGPISQSQFLGSLGINFRVEALLQNGTEEQVDALRTGYWRLVGDGVAPFWEGPEEQTPIGMGTRYQVMAIVNKRQGVPAPFH